MKIILLFLITAIMASAQIPKPGGGGDDFSVQRALDDRITVSVLERTEACGVKNSQPKNIVEVYQLIMTLQLVDSIGKPISGQMQSPVCDTITGSQNVRCLLMNSKEELAAFVSGPTVAYLQHEYKFSEEDAQSIQLHLQQVVKSLVEE